MYALGLNRYPSIQTLINIASKPTNSQEQRNRALVFFTAFYHTYEYNRTDISKFTEAFLPSEPINGKPVLCNPSEIYSNPACKVFGFYVLDRRFISDASKFGVKTDPSPAALERAIIRNPPLTAVEAREKFAYAYQRIQTFTKAQLTTLGRSKIVPVTRNGVTIHVPPYLCFLDTYQETESVWVDIFDFVNFGDPANTFLEALGVKDTPDAAQIADQLARDPKRIYQAMDIAGYLRLLSTLGASITVLQRDKALWTRLKASAFLVGLITVVAEDSGEKTVATLAKAEDIVIVDEPRLGVIFRPKLIAAPERDDCETLYMALGAPHLSSLVRQKFTHRGSPTTNAATEDLRKHIIERAGIFLTLPEVASQVKKASFLADNLRIYAYDALQVERTLVFGRIRASETEKVTALVDTSVKGCLLLVTDPKRVSFNQVAEALNSVVLKKTNRGTDLMFETILKENLEFLRFRGFPVDRLLNRHLEEQRLAKAKKEAEERERIKEEKAKQEKAKLEAEQKAVEARKSKEQKLNEVMGNGDIRQINNNEHTSKIPGAWHEDPQFDEKVLTNTPPTKPQTKPTFLPPSQPDRRNTGLMDSIKTALGLPNPFQPDRHQQPQATQTTSNLPSSKSTVENQLERAIKASKRYNESSLFAPATSSVVHEAPQSYCDSTSEQDLQLYSSTPPWDMGTFYVRDQRAQFDQTLSEREVDFHIFAGLIKELAKVYNAPVACFHIFYDPGRRSIAFNRSGSLFFNIA